MRGHTENIIVQAQLDGPEDTLVWTDVADITHDMRDEEIIVREQQDEFPPGTPFCVISREETVLHAYPYLLRKQS